MSSLPRWSETMRIFDFCTCFLTMFFCALPSQMLDHKSINNLTLRTHYTSVSSCLCFTTNFFLLLLYVSCLNANTHSVVSLSRFLHFSLEYISFGAGTMLIFLLFGVLSWRFENCCCHFFFVYFFFIQCFTSDCWQNKSCKMLLPTCLGYWSKRRAIWTAGTTTTMTMKKEKKLRILCSRKGNSCQCRCHAASCIISYPLCTFLPHSTKKKIVLCSSS